LEIENLSLGVSELTFHFIDKLIVVSFSGSLSISFHGFSHFHAFLYSVHDVEESLDDGLIGVDFHRFLNNLGEELEESTITVGNTLLGGLEFSESGDESGLHTGLGLKEGISTSDESVVDDGSAVVKDGEDRLVLGLKVGISLGFSFSLGGKSIEHGGSVTNFSLFVGELFLSRSKGSGVKSGKTFKFGSISHSLGHTRGKLSHVSVTSIVFGVGNSEGISHLLFEATNNTSHGFNKTIKIFSEVTDTEYGRTLVSTIQLQLESGEQVDGLIESMRGVVGGLK
jgi:hypothetical protein